MLLRRFRQIGFSSIISPLLLSFRPISLRFPLLRYFIRSPTVSLPRSFFQRRRTGAPLSPFSPPSHNIHVLTGMMKTFRRKVAINSPPRQEACSNMWDHAIRAPLVHRATSAKTISWAPQYVRMGITGVKHNLGDRRPS